ncbi:hypothetical protein DFH09DRAFT_952232, partial [Mycena vulgaris]
SLSVKPSSRNEIARAVGMWRAFDTEKFRFTPSYVPVNTIFPFPTASVLRLMPKPCTANGESNAV